MTDTDARIARLPKWAQQEIALLTRDLATARAKLAAGPDNSDTIADPYSQSPRPLGTGTRVRFHLGESDYVDAYIVGGDVEVAVQVGASARPAVMPRAGNVFRVGRADR